MFAWNVLLNCLQFTDFMDDTLLFSFIIKSISQTSIFRFLRKSSSNVCHQLCVCLVLTTGSLNINYQLLYTVRLKFKKRRHGRTWKLNVVVTCYSSQSISMFVQNVIYLESLACNYWSTSGKCDRIHVDQCWAGYSNPETAYIHWIIRRDK